MMSQSRQSVKPGDMIEISTLHGRYEDWALYVGENEVMHLVPLSLTKAIIKQEKLEKVVGTDQWRVNNYLDGQYVPRDIQDILEEAWILKDTEVHYNLLTNNCKHMVTNLRYGKPKSRQVKLGALIEISRKNKPYKDWALCVEENEVIHIVELSPTKAIFKQEKLEKVVGSDKWCVNNSLYEKYDARDVQLILEEARKLKDTEVHHYLLTNNCKHMVTDWRYGKPESCQVKPGDLIEISRKGGLYKHWALYMGENEVMHLASKSALTKPIIKQEKLEDVVLKDPWRVNNSLDEKYKPMDIKVILIKAWILKDTEVHYSLLTNNCEHMVTNLRYGKPESRQARKLAVGCVALLGVLFVVLPIVFPRKKQTKRRPGQRQFAAMDRWSKTTGPTEEEVVTIPREEDESVFADVDLEPHQFLGPGFWSSTTGPTEERRETVPSVEDGLEPADRGPGQRQFTGMGHGSSTTGPTEESREEDGLELADRGPVQFAGMGP